jgi:hypothetical protein
VRHVPRHERQLDTKTVIVEAYFGLKRGESHAEVCRYNTAGQVRIIARDSDPDVLRSIDQGKHEFRLHILHEALGDAPAGGPQERGGALPSNRPKAIRVDRQGRLNSYIKTLHQILTLRALAEDDAELAAVLTLEYHGKKVPWKSFYFETERYVECFDLLERSGYRAHPVCLAGQIAEIQPPTERFNKYSVRLESPWIEVDANGCIGKPVARIAVPEESWVEQLRPGDEVLGYGFWRIKRGASKSDNFSFLNLDLYPQDKGQLLVL